MTPSSVANQVLLSALRLIGVLSYVNCPASHENVTWFLKTKACFCGIAAAPGMGPWRLQYISANDLLIVTEVKPGLFLCRMLSQHVASFFFLFPSKRTTFFEFVLFVLFCFFKQFSCFPCSLSFPRASIQGLVHSSGSGLSCLSHCCQPDGCCPVSCSTQSCQIPPGSIPLDPAKTDALSFKRQSLLAAAVTTCARATTAAASTLMSCA